MGGRKRGEGVFLVGGNEYWEDSQPHIPVKKNLRSALGLFLLMILKRERERVRVLFFKATKL